MMTFAPASASASAHANPIPCPAPVTTAVRPSSLNFSRYIFLVLLAFFPVHRSTIGRLLGHRSRPNDPTVLVKAVQARRIRRKPHVVAGFQIELSDAARREHSEFPGVDIEEGVAAQVLGDGYRPGPAFCVLADFQVLGPDADGGSAAPARFLSGHGGHLLRTDEAGAEEVSGP